MSETVTNWRVLAPVERASLQHALDYGGDWGATYVGGSLHVDEYHIVIGEKTYRYFLPCGDRDAVFNAETEVEVSWESKRPADVPGQITNDQRQIHFYICREGDKFAETIKRIKMDENVRDELVNQIIAMQRVAMLLNTPGRALSSSKLNRF